MRKEKGKKNRTPNISEKKDESTDIPVQKDKQRRHPRKKFKRPKPDQLQKGPNVGMKKDFRKRETLRRGGGHQRAC